jgi:hypothetical protein
VDALRAHQLAQEEARGKAGNRWNEDSYVIATAAGTAMDNANVRRDFCAVLAKVDGIDPRDWRFVAACPLPTNLSHCQRL